MLKGEIVVLDTEDFTRPVALVEMPFAMRNRVHGNWIPNANPGKPLPRLTKPVRDVAPSTLGALNRVYMRESVPGGGGSVEVKPFVRGFVGS